MRTANLHISQNTRNMPHVAQQLTITAKKLLALHYLSKKSKSITKTASVYQPPNVNHRTAMPITELHQEKARQQRYLQYPRTTQNLELLFAKNVAIAIRLCVSGRHQVLTAVRGTRRFSMSVKRLDFTHHFFLS